MGCYIAPDIASRSESVQGGLAETKRSVRDLCMQTICSRSADPEIAATVGVLLYDATTEPHAVLMAAVDQLRARGLTVGGLLQRRGQRLPSGKRGMWLDDIATGTTIRLDEPRGAGASSCMLDTDALARGASLLRQHIDAGLSVMIVNRFGALEAEGTGLRAEIAEAICAGAVVLIPVRADRLPAMEAFLGCEATVLPASPIEIAEWAQRAANAPAVVASPPGRQAALSGTLAP